MKISSKLYQKIQDEVNYYSDIDAQWRTDYSGRGMYGKTCVGITTNNPMKACMALAVVLDQMVDDDDYFNLKDVPSFPHWTDLTVRTDSMGLSTIVYFPNLQVTD